MVAAPAATPVKPIPPAINETTNAMIAHQSKSMIQPPLH
jgi:hypothetical protein